MKAHRNGFRLHTQPSSVPGAMPCDLMMAGFFQVEFQPPANTDQIILFNLEELAKKVGFFAAA